MILGVLLVLGGIGVARGTPTSRERLPRRRFPERAMSVSTDPQCPTHACTEGKKPQILQALRAFNLNQSALSGEAFLKTELKICALSTLEISKRVKGL